MSCNTARDLLFLYKNDKLSDETRSEVDAHLEDCGECRALYENYTEKSENNNVALSLGENFNKLSRHEKKRRRRRKIIAFLVFVFALTSILNEMFEIITKYKIKKKFKKFISGGIFK